MNVTDVGKISPASLLQNEKIVKPQKDHELKIIENLSREEGEFLQKNAEPLHNGHGTETISDKSAKERPYSDDLNKSRFLFLSGFILIAYFPSRFL